MSTSESRASGGAGGGGVRLRPVGAGDVGALYEMQCDPESNAMAGTKPRTREAFCALWEKQLQDPGLSAYVIEVEGETAGSIACFRAGEQDCVGYWIARRHWGKGIGTRALALFLERERRRPLHATALSANTGSRRMLERCGFTLVALSQGTETDRYTAGEIADYVLNK